MSEERIKHLKEEIKAIDAQQRTLGDAKAKKHLELAALLCPFKVGQTGQLNGHSYRGKRGIVQSIYLQYGNWHCDIVVLKADGTQSANTTWIYREEDFILEG